MRAALGRDLPHAKLPAMRENVDEETVRGFGDDDRPAWCALGQRR